MAVARRERVSITGAGCEHRGAGISGRTGGSQSPRASARDSLRFPACDPICGAPLALGSRGLSTPALALTLTLVASLAETARAEPCAPRAELGGDAEAVVKVQAELQRLGVDARPAKSPEETREALRASLRGSRCPMVVAAVELDRSGGIAVAVQDASQRSEGRVVSDAVLAAAWIDSWLRDDFIAPDEVLAPPAAAPGAITPAAPRDTPPAQAAPGLPMLDQFSLAASFVESWTDDQTSWSGVAVAGCVRTGGVCVGARAGYAWQDVTADVSAAAKRDMSLFATLSYSEELGRMSIAPELGVGIGRLTTSRIEGCKVAPPPMCDPTTDPNGCMGSQPPMTMCDGTGTTPGAVYVGDNFSATIYTPRISAAVRIAIPLFDHVWLDGLAAATAAPLGHTGDYATSPDGTVMTNTGAFPLPGDPTFGVQLGVGLRVGAR